MRPLFGRGPRGQSPYRLWFSVIIHLIGLVKKLNLNPHPQSVLHIEGSGGQMYLIWVMWKPILEYLRLQFLILIFFY